MHKTSYVSLSPLGKQPGRILRHLLMHTAAQALTGTATERGQQRGHPVRCAHKSTL